MNKIMGGRPTIRGLRFFVGDGLELLGCGLWEEEILAEHPDLEKKDIKASLRYASLRLETAAIHAG